MGLLCDIGCGERVLLRGYHVLGRHPVHSDTVLPQAEASQLHAVLRWCEGAWQVVDHSRNGTWLDGRRLAQGQATGLAQGQVLRFGPGGAQWQLRDVSPPCSALLPLDAALPPRPLHRLNLLPAPEAPQLCLFEAGAGEWMLEQQGQARALRDGDELEVDGVRHRLFVTACLDETQAVAMEMADSLWLRFRVSLDEEHTTLQVRCGAREVDLGERSHHYTLLTLARRRLADAQAGLDVAAQGWLERVQLARMLGVDVTHLNIQIFRAREQLVGAMPHAQAQALSRVLEGRRGGLRLGAVGFEIHRGSTLEGRLVPPTDLLP